VEIFQGGSTAHPDDWPSLHEVATSFIDCEISSTGSWLDIGRGFEDEQDLDAVLVSSEKLSAPISWSSLVQKTAKQGAPAKLPAAGVKVPPLLPPCISSKEGTSLQPDDKDFVLECLENRRLRPQSTRGCTQRLRAKG